MQNLLQHDLIVHYGLPHSTAINIAQTTNLSYFEIEDNNNRNLILHSSRGIGMANFSNPNNIDINIINYDKFISSIPHHPFQQGRKRCDIIVTSEDSIILGELKDRNPREEVRAGAQLQLLHSLNTLWPVSAIQAYINVKTIKKCCYFNRQSNPPVPTINALRAFNRLPNTFPNGFKMANPAIEAFGFDFFEYTGSQTVTLQSRSIP